MNKILLIAALAQLPELSYTPTGVAVLRATLAGERSVVTTNGETKSIPFYIQIERLGKYAETLAERNMQAGDVLMVDGQLDYREWDNETGKHNAVRVKLTGAVREVAGEFDIVQDAAGSSRLKGGHNAVSLVGNLASDAQLRYTPSGDAVVELRVAVNESWKNARGEKVEKVHWITVTVWRELAEQHKDLKKGDPVLVEGALIDEAFADKEGNKRRQQKVEANLVVALKKNSSSTNASNSAPAPVKRERELATVGAPTGTLDIDQGDFPPEADLPF